MHIVQGKATREVFIDIFLWEPCVSLLLKQYLQIVYTLILTSFSIILIYIQQLTPISYDQYLALSKLLLCKATGILFLVAYNFIVNCLHAYVNLKVMCTQIDVFTAHLFQRRWNHLLRRNIMVPFKLWIFLIHLFYSRFNVKEAMVSVKYIVPSFFRHHPK